MPAASGLNPAVLAAALGAVMMLAAAAVVSKGIAQTSGWNALAERYPCRNEPPRPRRLGSGVFRRWLGYNNAILYAADQTGLYILPLPVLLSWTHAPICVPWHDIEAFEERAWFGVMNYRLRTRGAPEIDFAIRGRAFHTLREAVLAAGVPIRPEKS